MDIAARVGAIVTGSVALVCGLVNLSWWIDPRFGAYSSFAVMFTAFMVGFIGWFAMVGLLLAQGLNRRRLTPMDAIGIAGPVLRVWRTPLRLLLLVALGIALATAVAGAKAGNAVTGPWGIDAPYGWHNCHWPLTANHDTEHMCVSHARYVAVDKATNRGFVAFGIGGLTIACIVFTTLACTPREPGTPRGTARPAELPSSHA